MELDQLQHYSPVACDTAEQNFSATFISLPFHFRKEDRRALKKVTSSTFTGISFKTE
jgi:hypothetical protein